MKHMSREQALEKVQRREVEEKINFVTTFSSYLPNVKKILQENFHHLQREGLQEVIKEPPQLSLRRGRNLGDLIIDAKPKHEVRVSGPCSGCKLCESMRQTTTFSGRDGMQFQVRGNFNCESVGMVYAMHCDKCGHVVYVGKSQKFLKRTILRPQEGFQHQGRRETSGTFFGGWTWVEAHESGGS